MYIEDQFERILRFNVDTPMNTNTAHSLLILSKEYF